MRKIRNATLGIAALAAGALTFSGVESRADGIQTGGQVTIVDVAETSQPFSASPWSGTYVGVQANWFHLLEGALGRSLSSAGRPGTAANIGVHAGVRGEAGPYILGLEFEANGVGFTLQNGQTVDAHFLAKGKFGVPFGKFLMSASFGPSVYFGSGIHATGFVFGGGVDYMVNDKVTVGIEYLNHKMSGWGAVDARGFVPDPRAEAGTVSLRAGYKF